MRRVTTIISALDNDVSIHAPAGGATHIVMSNGLIVERFNPRTRRGCDKYGKGVPVSAEMFQSTHPQGVRQFLAQVINLINVVSIHAPAGGATNSGGRVPPHTLGFNPRTRRGCDARRLISLCPLSVFQSTHPQGVRRMRLRGLQHAQACFNPRTRRGCDT